jgi:hypothetical protein
LKGAERGDDRAVRLGCSWRSIAAQDRQRGARQCLVGQAGLTDPSLAAQEQQPAVSARDVEQRPIQLGALAVSADQRRLGRRRLGRRLHEP